MCGSPGERKRPTDQIRVVGRHTRRGRSHDLETVACADVEAIAEVERHHLGVDEVVAVGRRPVTRSETVSLAGANSSSMRRSLAGQSAPRLDVELFGTRSGSMPAAAICAGVASPASEPRSILRRCPNPARTSLKSHFAVDVAAHRRCFATDDADKGRLDVRLGQEHGGGHSPDHFGLSPSTRPSPTPRRTPRRPARRRAARPPRAAPSPASARSAARRRAGRRRAAWPRCTAGWRRAPIASSPRSADQSSVQRVGLDHAHALSLDDRAQAPAADAAVDLDRRHRGARLGQSEGERAEAGADLDDLVAGADSGEAGDAADRVRIDDEVLAEARLGLEPVVWRVSAATSPGHAWQRHQVMRTLITPAPTGASSANCSSSRSMIRPSTNGPRSRTTHARRCGRGLRVDHRDDRALGQRAVRARPLAPQRIGVVVPVTCRWPA